MKGDAKVIEFLNKVLYNELTAINQYWLHYRMYKDWGYNELAEHEQKESIEEMKHADHLIERILFLDGLPNLQHLGKLRIGENPVECLQGDLDLEMAAVKDLRESIAYSEGVADFTALGDSVNTAARLASSAGAGEVLLSEPVYTAVAEQVPNLERRNLTLRGKEAPVAVRVLGPAHSITTL
jgi:bacterioferritin